MDILTHAVSGMAIGSCVAAISKKGMKQKVGIAAISGLGGVIADIDAISLWSKFDGSIGHFFGLTHTGKDIYSGKLWYSHHGFMHSLFAALIFAVFIVLTLYAFNLRKKLGKKCFREIITENSFLLIAFIAGMTMHFLGDMVTPGGPWGGIRIFFPAKVYIGGSGDIWWWNNYDVFLIALSTLTVNTLIITVAHFLKRSSAAVVAVIFLLGLTFATVQIKSREYDFNTHTYAQNEEKSKEIQQKILGKKLFRSMEKFDNSVRVHF